MAEFSAQINGVGASDDEIAAFEQFLHAPLPGEYRAFLTQHNGCIPSPETDTFLSRVDLVVGREFTVEQFYTLNDKSPPLLSLYRALEDHVEIMPLGTLPIGHDSFGNIIGLDSESGEVNWTLCQPGYELDLYRNFDLRLSFSEFLHQLKPGPYAITSHSEKETTKDKHEGWLSRLKGGWPWR